MNCEESRHLIGLDVGCDLRPTEVRNLQSHLQSCPDCRTYLQAMKRAFSILATARELPPSADRMHDPEGSRRDWLISEIRRRARDQHSVRQFNGWVVALCVCSLMLAAGTVVQQLPAGRRAGSISIAPTQHASLRSPVVDFGQPRIDWPDELTQFGTPVWLEVPHHDLRPAAKSQIRQSRTADEFNELPSADHF